MISTGSRPLTAYGSRMADMKTQIILRPFDPASDFRGWVELRNAIYPHNPVSVESVRFHWDTLDQRRFHRERHLALDHAAARLVGSAGFSHEPEMFHPDKYVCHVYVHPDSQGRGIGTQLWEWLQGRLRDRGAVLARCGVWENHPHAVAFAAHRGFREKRRAWQSILEVHNVDLGGLAYRWDRVATQGIVLTTLTDELERDAECLPKLYTLSNEALRHTPLPDVPTDPPYEMFYQWIMESPRRLPQAFFIAADGARYVGVSFLEKGDEEGTILQGLTATDPEYMRRGIAWALKLNTVKYAQENGYERIKTWNDTENQPMLSINLRLGFQPLPATITMEREFER